LLNKPYIPAKPEVPVRWIVTDLDGTLLNSRQQIDPDLVGHIRRFIGAGGRFTLATGRTLSSALPFIRLLQMIEPVILCNGACIYDPIEDRYVMEQHLPAGSVREVIRLYEEAGTAGELDLLLFQEEHIYSAVLSEQVNRQMHKDGVEIEQRPLEWMAAYGADKVTKMMLIGPAPHLMEFQKILAIASLNTVQSESQLLEVLPHGVNKSTGLSALIGLTGAPADGMAVVGDNLNDLEMIRTVPHGFAVANANPEVKRAAAYVLARSNEENALLDVIQFAVSTWPSGMAGA